MAINEFQLALIGAGVTAVAGIWAYNSWQEYRQRKVTNNLFSGGQQDVLVDGVEHDVGDLVPEKFDVAMPPALDERRIEPVFNQPQMDEEIEMSAEFAEPEHVVDSLNSSYIADEEVPPPTSVADIPAPGDELLDPMIEFGIALPPELGFANLQAAWQQSAVFRKRVRWIAHDAPNGEWFEAASGGGETGSESVRDARHAHVAIQLADRQGVIEKSELVAFCQTAEAVAAGLGVEIGLPSIEEVYAHACALDEICASVDIQIAIHIVGRTGQFFAGSKLRGLLEASGFQLAQDGQFYLYDDKGRPSLSVCRSGTQSFDTEQLRTGAVSDITFWLDVPRVGNGAAAFDTMLTLARRVAAPLDGVLVDDHRNPLADTALSGIRDKVVELQKQMTIHGIPAGGRRALRLFS